MKSLLRQLVPPLFKTIWSKLDTSLAPSYVSYEEALAHCPPDGYEDPDIVRVVVEKNIAFRQQMSIDPVFDLGMLRTVIGACLAKTGNIIRVIDFGGGGGYHYTVSKAALGNDVDLRWNVVETAAMVNEASRTGTAALGFFDSIEKAREDLGQVDLVFTSGALHYCPDPLSFLKALLQVKARYIFITRTSFSDSRGQLATIQKSFLSTNGPGPLPLGFQDRAVFYPAVFVSRNDVEGLLATDYHIRFRSLEEKSAYRAGDSAIDMYGYFCVRKETAGTDSI